MGWTARYQILRDRPLDEAELLVLDEFVTRHNRPPWEGERFAMVVTRSLRNDRVVGDGVQKLPMTEDESADLQRLCDVLNALPKVIEGVEVRIRDDFGAFGWDKDERRVTLQDDAGPPPIEIVHDHAAWKAPSEWIPGRFRAMSPAMAAFAAGGGATKPETLRAALVELAHLPDERPARLALVARCKSVPPLELALAGLGAYGEIGRAWSTWELVLGALETIFDVTPLVEPFLAVWRAPRGIYWYGDLRFPERVLDALARWPVVEAQMTEDLRASLAGGGIELVHRRAEHAAQMLGRARTATALAMLLDAAQTMRGRALPSGVKEYTQPGVCVGLTIAGVPAVVPSLLLEAGIARRATKAARDALQRAAQLAPPRAAPLVAAAEQAGEGKPWPRIDAATEAALVTEEAQLARAVRTGDVARLRAVDVTTPIRLAPEEPVRPPSAVSRHVVARTANPNPNPNPNPSLNPNPSPFPNPNPSPNRNPNPSPLPTAAGLLPRLTQTPAAAAAKDASSTAKEPKDAAKPTVDPVTSAAAAKAANAAAKALSARDSAPMAASAPPEDLSSTLPTGMRLVAPAADAKAAREPDTKETSTPPLVEATPDVTDIDATTVPVAILAPPPPIAKPSEPASATSASTASASTAGASTAGAPASTATAASGAATTSGASTSTTSGASTSTTSGVSTSTTSTTSGAPTSTTSGAPASATSGAATSDPASSPAAPSAAAAANIAAAAKAASARRDAAVRDAAAREAFGPIGTVTEHTQIETPEGALIDELLTALAREKPVPAELAQLAGLPASVATADRWERAKAVRARLLELGAAQVGVRLVEKLAELHDGSNLQQVCDVTLPAIAAHPGMGAKLAALWEDAHARPWEAPHRVTDYLESVSSVRELVAAAIDELGAPDDGALRSRTSSAFGLLARVKEHRDVATAAVVARLRTDRGRPRDVVGWRGDAYKALRRLGGAETTATAILELAEPSSPGKRPSELLELVSKAGNGAQLLVQAIDLPELAGDATRELCRSGVLGADGRARFLAHPFWKVRLVAADSQRDYRMAKAETRAIWQAIDSAGLASVAQDRNHARPDGAGDGKSVAMAALPPARDGLDSPCADYRAWALWAVDERYEPADLVARIFADELDRALVALGHARTGPRWPRWLARVPRLPADRRGRLAWATAQRDAVLSPTLTRVRDEGAAAVALGLPPPYLVLSPAQRDELLRAEEPLATRGLGIFRDGLR